MTVSPSETPAGRASAVPIVPSADDATARALAGARQTRRYGSWYVAEHRVRAMGAYRGTIAATTIGNPLIYLLALGVGLATLVGTRMTGIAAEPVSYLAFVAPALLASAAVTAAAEETTYPVMQGFIWNPIFVAANATPISAGQIVNGIALGVLARILPATTIYFLFMLAFGAVPSGWGALSILAGSLTGMCVGLLIMSFSSTVTEDRGQMAIIMRFGITPMFLFSGTFFPLAQLPVYLQWIGWISPLWHGAQLGRVATIGLLEPAWLTVVHVLYLVLLGVLAWLSARRTFARRLNK